MAKSRMVKTLFIMKNEFTVLLIVASIVAVSINCTNYKSKQDQILIAEPQSSMRYIQNGRIKLGVDLNLGGAVTYLSDQANGGENMINSYDWGRQIQQSYYSGPWPYIGPNGETPKPEWAGLGWNPIQSGDVGANRSKVIYFKQFSESSFLIRTIPMQWPHHTGVPGECVFESQYTLDNNVITLKAKIENKRLDKTQYVANAQEMPAVYTNGPWYKIVTYLGDQPFENEPLTEIVTRGDQKGWPWVHFYTPESWVALLDDNGMGIGIYQPDVMLFNAGFYPNDSFKGFGTEKDIQTGHIAPLGKQILDHNIIWTYETSFILGELSAIRKQVYLMKNLNKPVAWEFVRNRQSWYYEGMMNDKGFPIEGELDVNYAKNSSFVSPLTFWKAEHKPSLILEGSFLTSSETLTLNIDIYPVAESDFTDWLNWSEGDADVQKEREIKAILFPNKPAITLQHTIKADGVSRKHYIDLSSVEAYVGCMKSLKFTMKEQGTGKIKSVVLQ